MFSAATSLGFGFASTYEEALFWRSLMGIGNGITGTIKCLLSEIKASSGSEARETKTMAIVYGMRGYGFLLCPAITGYLSDPMKQYPRTMEAAVVPEWFRSLLLAYPFVLPNLLACVLCWMACWLVRNHVEETLPESRRKPWLSFVPSDLNPTGCCRFCHRLRFGRIADENKNEIQSQGKPSQSQQLSVLPGNDENNETETKTQTSKAASTSSNDLLWSCSANRDKTEEEDKSGCEIGQQQRQRKMRGRWYHLYVYWIFSFLSIASDELFPLFCLSKLSGLGLIENQISFLLGGTTIVYGLLQYLLLTGLVRKLGLYPTLRIGAFCSIPPSILIPIGSLWLTAMDNNNTADVGDTNIDDNTNTDGSEHCGKKLTLPLVSFLCVLIAATKSFSSIMFSTITVATNRTVDTIDQRATLNGIASLGGSVAKACGPVFAGTLFSFLAGTTASGSHGETASAEGLSSSSPSIVEPPYGSIVAYGMVSVLGLLLGMKTLALREINAATS